MPVESRQWPLWFHAVQNDKFRSNYDDIFRKPKDVPVEEQEERKAPDDTKCQDSQT